MCRIFLTVCLIASTLLAAAQTKDTLYKKQWQEIDSLVFKQNLSRSALDKVDNIYTKAKNNNNQVQMIKALLYKLNLEEKFQEKNINKEIDFLTTESKNAKSVVTKSILYSLIAEKYRNYFSQNRYNLYQRSKTVNYKKEDITTWNADDFHAAITKNYQQSLSASPVLKNENIDAFSSILTFYNTKIYRPSLYDLLAHAALAYFKSDETYITKPAYAFIINDAAALGNIYTFTNHSFTTKDSLSNKWKALLLFQDLMRFHIEKKDTAALIDINLERIEYAKNNGSVANKDSLYYEAVKENVVRFENNRYAAQAWFLLASWHSQKANQYNANGDTSSRWENVKALEICKKFIHLTDSTEGHYNLFNLYQSIIAKNLHTTTEQVNVPNAAFRMLVTYKNTGTLYYRVIKSTKAIEDTIENSRKTLGYNGYVNIASSFPYILQQQVNLPINNDYQQHSVEVKLDALPVGKYLVFSSSLPDFSNKSNLTLSTVYVSNISFINNGQHYFTLDRTTGQPLKKASVSIWESTYNNKKSRFNKVRKESYTTDDNGYFKLSVIKNQNRNILLDIKYQQDELFTDNQQNAYPLSYFSNQDNDDENDSDSEYEEEHSKAFFFKDRSIYRPGQLVYFKMIALTKDRKNKKMKLYIPVKNKDSMFVYLEDVNNKKVDSLKIKLNEYGSFAGTFKLPVNVLTGEFSLSSDLNEDRNGNFSVEEYKRPTFYVTLEKPKGTYRLNDTLTITGSAKAYAGNSVDGAHIKFTVTRKGRFLYPWLWYRSIRPSVAETTITFGEAVTDATGKFTVKFAALADEAVAKESLPIFDFDVHADVTDIAGETRSQSTHISVAYHSLNVTLSVKETTEADSLKSVFINTTNIAGDKEPASVTVTISPLTAPTQLIRKRYWQQPDQFIYSRGEYRQYFPHDEYKNESDKTTWQKETPVFSATINTIETGKVDFTKTKFSSGWFLFEATTKDKDGHEVKDVKYVQLYSRNDGQFNTNSYLFTSVNSNVTTPGGSASFLIGSGASDVHLIEQIQHKPKAKTTAIESDFSFRQINKNIDEIVASSTTKDIGGMGVNFAFVKDNRVYVYNENVRVEEETSNLNVEVLTYRNKIEPGSQEKWTVRITGKNKDAAAAEVLTSMYDASLDQFKPHQWQIPLEPISAFYTNGWNNNNGFTQAASLDNYLPVESKNFYKQYSQIDVGLSRPYNNFLRRNETVKLEEVYYKVFSDDYMIRREYNAASRLLQGRVAGLSADSQLNEVVVVGYGAQKKLFTTGAVTTVNIRGNYSLSSDALYVVDGKIISSISDVNPDDIASMQILKDAATIALYGARAANGVVVITTKNGAAKAEEQLVKVRTNFNETAFFSPELTTDKNGNVSFTFTLPDALTQWKWQILAHDKQANFGLDEKTIVSQKTLMVQANAPRFMREGDKMEFSAKVSNLSEKALTGKATFKLIDAITLQPVDDIFINTSNVQNFTAAPGQSTAVNFSIAVPANFSKPVIWQIIAKADQFADGEENTLPVLTNRMLVTESLPLFVKGDTTKKFEFTKLLHQQSETLKNESVTVEYTSNPVWYAMQSLPYLVAFPYECSEQTFNRFFANALAAKIINSNLKIKEVFDEWKKDTSSLKSNLQKNEELKNILLQETPWVLQAESEEQQKKNLALLFDSEMLNEAFKNIIEKLKQMQESTGGFPWFKGGREDRYITQYIVTGIGRLQNMNAITPEQKDALLIIAKKGLGYLDDAITDDYNNLKKYKTDLKKNNVSFIQIQYLYTKSFFQNSKQTQKNSDAYNYYYTQAKQYWIDQSNYFKAMIGDVLVRNGEVNFVVKNILPAIVENAVIGDETGMYWKQNEHGYYWYQAPIEQQALMIEFVNEVYQQQNTTDLQTKIDEMKTWLLRQKQTNHWSTTKATADACYALLLNGSDWVSANKQVAVKLGNYAISSNQQKQEAGSGYFKAKIEANNIMPAMGNVSVTTTSVVKIKGAASPSWGAVYWQYFEDLDKITPSATPLSISKKLFVEKNTERGAVLQPVNDGDELKVGDRVKIRIEIRTDRNMEYVQLKDMRAANMEPINVLSGYKWQDGLGYYESTRDAATNFFISNLPKGTYVFEYPVNITNNGDYSVGIASAQCMYAPEFNSHSEGIRIKVKRP